MKSYANRYTALVKVFDDFTNIKHLTYAQAKSHAKVAKFIEQFKEILNKDYDFISSTEVDLSIKFALNAISAHFDLFYEIVLVQNDSEGDYCIDSNFTDYDRNTIEKMCSLMTAFDEDSFQFMWITANL